MRHLSVHIARFPIRLLFADVCLICRPAHAGLVLSDALTPEYVGCSTAVGSPYFGFA